MCAVLHGISIVANSQKNKHVRGLQHRQIFFCNRWCRYCSVNKDYPLMDFHIQLKRAAIAVLCTIHHFDQISIPHCANNFISQKMCSDFKLLNFGLENEFLFCYSWQIHKHLAEWKFPIYCVGYIIISVLITVTKFLKGGRGCLKMMSSPPYGVPNYHFTFTINHI